MDCMIGYMLTWTTYGSWLQGNEKGYVKDGVVYGEDARLMRANKKLLQRHPVKLTQEHRRLIGDEIRRTAEMIGQEILAMAVCSNHVHLVAVNTGEQVENVVRQYKCNTTYVMRKSGAEGKVWTKGYDKRFCYDKKDMQR